MDLELHSEIICPEAEQLLSEKVEKPISENTDDSDALIRGAGRKPKKKGLLLKLRRVKEEQSSENEADVSESSMTSKKEDLIAEDELIMAEERPRRKGLSRFLASRKKTDDSAEGGDLDISIENNEKDDLFSTNLKGIDEMLIDSDFSNDVEMGLDTGLIDDQLLPENIKKPAKKKRLALSLKKGKSSGKSKKKKDKSGKKNKSSKKDKKEKSDSESQSDIFKKIEKLINPTPESIEEFFFETGELSVPVPGVPQRELDLVYEVTPGFQYVHVKFVVDELRYECMEPPMSDSEMESLRIIQNAFDKMAHSEILLVEEENRKEALRDRFNFIVEIYRFKLTNSQKEKFFYYLHKKYMGFDRIDILMNDPYLEDVTCNGPYSPLYVNHRVYGSVRTDIVFEEIELNNFVMRMAQAAGRHISILQPIRDATLIDGSRANLTLGKEVTKRGSTFTIRRFRSNPVSCIDLMNYGTYDSRVLAYFWLMIEYKRSVLAAGGTASGKTTTLNALGSFIPPEYKIVSIEDTAEMNLMHPNWTQSITRAGFGGDSGGKSAGDVELFDLLKAALRQRPEYIVVGEVRGSEAGTLFQAISVGHPCMGTIHAGSIHELLSRVESEPMNVPRNLFASVDMVIFNAMIKVGEHFIRRALRIVEIVELDPERGDLITNPVFKWDPVADRYEFSGSSSLFEDIRDEFGIDEDELVREMDMRARYIENLAEQGISQYEDVARAIRKYSREKDELTESMH